MTLWSTEMSNLSSTGTSTKRKGPVIVVPDESPTPSTKTLNGGNQHGGKKKTCDNTEQENNDSMYDYKITAHEILQSSTGEYEVL